MMPSDRCVVYADDDPDDRFLFEQAYEDAGIRHPLCLVEDGADAIEHLAGSGRWARGPRHPAGLVLLDIKMPRKTGLETLEWIRAQTRLSRLPVCMLTSSLSPRDIDEAYRLGATAFLVKPSTTQELTELLGAISAFWLRFVEPPAAQ